MVKIHLALTVLLLPPLLLSIGHAEGRGEDKAHDAKHEHSKLHSASTVAGLHVELIVEPATIEPNVPVRFSHEFMDSITGELKDTVPHTFMLVKEWQCNI
ncbi:MAG: hypothetical protein RMJ59_07150 [Candidatus Nitrosocaldus sp.]|nr:hypothetical protein [Candidatus Nitrosocaldus sp.]MDW8276135.1 hypothetical protein [Candidatus Nitrosocaldus sp.]